MLTKFKSMENELKLLQSKLRRPIHITYISEHILKKDLNETRKIINSLVSDGFIVESKSAKDYFSIK